MTELSQLSTRDLEQLSAYLDGELSARESERLRARLDSEPNLKRAMQQLRATVGILHDLPPVQRPRSFAVAEETPSRSYPFLQFSTALAALAFLVVVGADFLVRSTSLASEQAMIVSEEVDALADTDRSLGLAAEPELPAAESEAEGALQFAAPTDESVADPDLEQSPLPAAPAEESAAEMGESAPVGEEAMDEFFKSDERESEQPEAEEGMAREQAEEAIAREEAEEAIVREEAEDAVSEPPIMVPPVDAAAPGASVGGEQSLLLPALRVGEVILGMLLVLLIGLTLWTRRR